MLKRVLSIATFLLLGTLLVACGGGMGDNIQVSATRTNITIDVGATDSQRIVVTPQEEVENLVVKSSDESVATVTLNGREISITGVKAGEAVIVVSVKNSKAKVEIGVKVEDLDEVTIPETGFNLGRNEISLTEGTTRDIKVGAKPEILANIQVSSDDKGIATATINDDVITISGRKAGSATITVEEVGTNNKKTITVTVSSSGEQVSKLVIWADNTYWGGENGKLVAEMVKIYQEETGIEVIYEPQPNLKDRITAAALGGETADIVIWDRWETVAFVQDNMLVDLSQFVEDDEIDLNDYQQEALSEMEYQNKVYGLPLDIDAWGYWVNKTMVQEANARLTAAGKPTVSELPSTWDELRETAIATTQFEGEKMTVAGLNVDTAGSFYSYIQTAGGQLLDFDAEGKPIAAFNDAHGKAVIQYWYDLIHTHKVYAQGVITDAVTPADDPFIKGQVAIQSNSLLNGSKFYSQYIDDKFEYEFIPFPKGPSSEFATLTGKEAGTQVGGLMGGFGLVIPRTSTQHRAAWDLIKWWITDTEKVIKWAEISNLIPAKIAVIDELRSKNIPNVRNVLEVLPHLKVRPRVEGYPSVETSVIMALIPTVLFGDGYIKGNPTIEGRITALLKDMEKKANETFRYANM